jgi:phosphoribosylglycinamide formyltransferase-1
MARRRVGILISGRGSNMAALIAAAAGTDFPAEVVLVISSRRNAPGLDRAEAAGVPTATVVASDFPGVEDFERAIDRHLAAAGVEIVCLAGFMRILSEAFVERWRDRLLNIHPSILPAFPGLRTHERAIAAGVKLHGCTVHFVRGTTDEGPVIAQAAVPVLHDDTPDRLADRVLEAEHRLYPQALATVASGRTRVVDEHVLIEGIEPEWAGRVIYSLPIN